MISVAVRIATVLSAGFIPLLTACNSSPHGVVTGKLLAVGGPAPGVHAVPHGPVTARGPAGTQTTMTGRDGRYTLSLPPGVYHLSGRYKSVRCYAERGGHVSRPVIRAIHVRPGQTTGRVWVLCQIRL
jgi:hypothetical protein